SSALSFSTGTDSPVSIDSSTVDLPLIILPSTGIFSPGLTSTLSPLVSCEIGTSCTSSLASSLWASLGINLTSFSNALEAPMTDLISIQWPSNIISTKVANSQNKLCPSQPKTTRTL